MTFMQRGDSMRPKLLIVVLDLEDAGSHLSKGFGFYADAVIHFEMTTDDEGLLHRTVQISKIKSQKHAEGKHPIRIFTRPTEPIKQHKTPFLDVGGLFVFPNIAWHCESMRGDDGFLGQNTITKAFDLVPSETVLIASPSERSAQGFRSGQTVSLIGKHGTLKTRFAYASMLANVIRHDRTGLIVSLNADWHVVREILADIILSEFKGELGAFIQNRNLIQALAEYDVDVKTGSSIANPAKIAAAIEYVDSLQVDDRISFIHNEPSYITAAEFFHRVYVAYNRPRGEQKGSADGTERGYFVVVDGLDHIETKFPLCAKEKLFVSALVTLFKSGNKACAVFLSEQDPEKDSLETASALFPLSDLLLQFDDFANEIERDDKIYELGQAIQKGNRKPIQNIYQIARITALRVPFGGVSSPEGYMLALQSGVLGFRDNPAKQAPGPAPEF